MDIARARASVKRRVPARDGPRSPCRAWAKAPGKRPPGAGTSVDTETEGKNSRTKERKMEKKATRGKGLLALLFAAALTFGLMPTAAFAANDSLPPEKGNLHIHKYIMDDLDQSADPNNGEEAGTNGNPAVPASAKPINGITFDIYKVKPSATGDYPGDRPYRLNGTTLTDASTATFEVTHEGAQTTAGTNGDGTDKGQADFDGLDQGVYLVVEQPSDLVTSPAEPFVVAVPMTNAAGDGWLTDVHVYPKNEDMSIKKEVTSPDLSVNVGDTVSYAITPTVPSQIVAVDFNADGTPNVDADNNPVLNDVEDARISYVITDTLDGALTLDPASVKVYGLASATDATGTEITTGWTLGKDAGGNDFTIKFDAAGRLALYKADYKALRIEFSATVNKNILERDKHEVGNTASVDFVNRWGDDPKHKEDSSEDLHTATLDILKKDASGETKLSGAHFKIALSQADAEAGTYLRVPAGEKNVSNPSKVMRPADDGYGSGEDWELISDGVGKLQFQGIQDFKGSDNTDASAYLSYWLVETQAPEGYNLLDKPVQVDFKDKDTSNAGNSYTVSYTIENTNEFVLPLTGGAGTMLLTVAGVALVGGGIVALLFSRRKKDARK